MRFIASSVFLVILYCAKYQVSANDHDWCYEGDCGPSSWEGPCRTGKAQSPIDLADSLSRQNRGGNRTLRFDADYYRVHDKFYIVNNGHTVQVQLNENFISTCLMDGDGFKGSYVFAQMHFHWGSESKVGSEHTVDGKHYPMELHLVHFSDKYDTLTAAVSDNNRRAVAVLAIFFEITPKDNPALQWIVQNVPSVYKPETEHGNILTPKLAAGKLNLTSLLPKKLDLWRYEGSLTTPACAEKVVWSVFRQPIGISESQLEVFRQVKDSHGKPLVNNYRPTQAIARRVIRFFKIDHASRKTDDENNEIDDIDLDLPESTTNSFDADIHGNGIDHEIDADHVHSGEENTIDTTGDKYNKNKNNGAFTFKVSLINLALCCSFLYFTIFKL